MALFLSLCYGKANLGQPIASPHSHGAAASRTDERAQSLRVVKLEIAHLEAAEHAKNHLWI
ncbi:MAG: hypothetical protein ACHRXM_36840 [Isosphaerales bacterium]